MQLLEKEFKGLNLFQKRQLLEEKGQFLAERNFGSFHIELFSFGGFFAEVWRKRGISQIHWIEVPSKGSVADNYLQKFDIKGSLDI